MTPDKKTVSESYYHAARPELLKFVQKNDIQVLDIGCGSGNFGDLITQERNARVWGIEIEEEIAELAREKLHKVLCGNAEEVINTLPDNFFDLICFNDSLEHLFWPEKILEKCKAKLKPDGEILCSLPNMRYFRVMYDLVFRKKWEYEEAGILDKTHVRFYTVDSIKNLFHRCGYEIILLEGNQAGSKTKTKSWRFKIFQLVTLGNAADMRHGQFHIKARVASNI
jgi:SAM-dependent methyltransferase